MRDVSRDIPGLDLRAQNKGAAPTTIVFIVGTKLGMLYGAYHLCGAPLPAWLPAHWWPAVCTFNLAMCIPYIVRQGGLQLMSNTSHYYMDVPPGGDGLLKQVSPLLLNILTTHVLRRGAAWHCFCIWPHLRNVIRGFRVVHMTLAGSNCTDLAP
jgi:hypothetical protein